MQDRVLWNATKFHSMSIIRCDNKCFQSSSDGKLVQAIPGVSTCKLPGFRISVGSGPPVQMQLML